jgi:hypothetical protein
MGIKTGNKIPNRTWLDITRQDGAIEWRKRLIAH